LLARWKRCHALQLRIVYRLALEHPAFHRGLVLELLREFGEHSRGGDRILSDDEAGGTLELAADETALVHRAERERVLDDHVIDARSLEPAAKLGHPLHVESGEIRIVERLSIGQLVAQLGNELLLLRSLHH